MEKILKAFAPQLGAGTLSFLRNYHSDGRRRVEVVTMLETELELERLAEEYEYLYTPFYSKFPKLKRITNETPPVAPSDTDPSDVIGS